MEDNKTDESKEAEKKLSERKEKVKNWLKNPYNLMLLVVIAFSILIRLYYFWLTKNQPLWWDEAEYMSAAKGYAGIVDYKLQTIRLPGLSLVISLFFTLGITNEPVIRFLGLLIPSIAIILLTYFIILEMYPDKKIALISTAIISVLWEHLFYSNRFHTENFSLIFEFLAIFILFRCYTKKQNLSFIKPKYSLLWILFLSALSIFFRPGNMIFVPAILIFLFVINANYIRASFKRTAIAGSLLLALAVALVLLLINASKLPLIASYYHPHNPLAWNSFSIFYYFYQSVNPYIPSLLLYLFILGIFLSFLSIYLYFHKIKKFERNSEDLEIKSDVFNILLIIAVIGFFIFVFRAPSYEYRTFFPFLTGMLAFTSKGIISFSNFIGRSLQNKKVSTMLIILITCVGVYTQIVHADNITKMKIESYSQVRDSGLWIKENSDKKDIIVSASVTQHTYYSERKIEDFYINGSNENETAFNDEVNKLKPRYLVVSVFEPVFTPKWAFDWPQRHNESVRPVKAWFADEQQTQPLLIVYEFVNYSI